MDLRLILGYLMGHNEVCRFMTFVFEKLEDEPLKKRIELYEIVLELLPDERISQKLKTHLQELRLLEQKFKELKSSISISTLP
jgi:hypothetical protein